MTPVETPAPLFLCPITLLYVVRTPRSFVGKIGRDHQGSLELHQTPPASRLSRVAAVTGTTDASPILTKQRNGSNSRRPTDNSPPSNDPLWALLSAFAEPGPGPGGAGTLAESVVKGAAATAVATAAAAAAVVTGTAAGVAGFRLSFRHPTGRGAAATAATAEGAGTGGGGTATGDPGASAVASAGPLVVSVVATLRSGDAFYLEEKALLEVRIWPGGGHKRSQVLSPAVSTSGFVRRQLLVHGPPLVSFEKPVCFAYRRGCPLVRASTNRCASSPLGASGLHVLPSPVHPVLSRPQSVCLSRPEVFCSTL